MVGKVVNGNQEQPFAIAVVHDDEQRLALDAVLLDSAAIDILFSLSRAYFMVDMQVPSGYVEFLRTIMPTKPRSEIYSSLGLGKQGKTLFYPRPAPPPPPLRGSVHRGARLPRAGDARVHAARRTRTSSS